MEQELKLYLYDKKIYETLDKLKLKKGKKFFLQNLKICYTALIKKKFLNKSEIKYLDAWIFDCKNIL